MIGEMLLETKVGSGHDQLRDEYSPHEFKEGTRAKLLVRTKRTQERRRDESNVPISRLIILDDIWRRTGH
jgi:hypothetical protein